MGAFENQCQEVGLDVTIEMLGESLDKRRVLEAELEVARAERDFNAMLLGTRERELADRDRLLVEVKAELSAVGEERDLWKENARGWKETCNGLRACADKAKDWIEERVVSLDHPGLKHIDAFLDGNRLTNGALLDDQSGRNEGQMKSPNARIWKGHGLLPEFHTTADKAMDLMLEAVRACNGTDSTVYQEAVFQIKTLPGRSKKFQKANAWRKVKR